MKVRLVVSAVIAMTAIAVPAGAAYGAQGRPLAASTIVRDLEAGRPVIWEHATVRGTLNLTSLGTVSSVFACRDCRFDGALIASHVDFARGLDLSGSTLPRRVDFTAARFDDLADFRSTDFAGRAVFTATHFRSVARFGDATFGAAARFDDAIFSLDAAFAHSAFERIARFEGSAFGGVADFRQALFGRETTFIEAVFRGRAEFSRAEVAGFLSFDDARFGGDALFADAVFAADPAFVGDHDPVVSFNHASVRGRLDLARAMLQGPAELRDASAGSLSLDEIAYGKSAALDVDGLAATHAALDLGDLPYISGQADEQQRILGRAEDTAKEQGDLMLANALHYRVQELASQDDPLPRRVGDIVFYRSVAGYLVRPLRPLLWLLALVGLATFLRASRVKVRIGDGWAVRTGQRIVTAVEDTLAPRHSSGNVPPTLRRIEVGVYAVLLACFFLALANTNASLREMVDAVL
jgi:hypothetical protein